MKIDLGLGLSGWICGAVLGCPAMWTPPWARGSNQLGRLIFDAESPGSEPYTLVWRVEEADGTGVYGGDKALFRAGMIAYKVLTDREYEAFSNEMGNKHPIPLADFEAPEWEDLSKTEREKFLFGFRHPSDAYEWFGPIHLDLMEQVGAKLVQRRARKVFLSKSERQLIFLPAD